MPANSDRHSVLLSDFLRGCTRLMAVRPWVTLFVLAIVCVACGVYTSRNLQFKANRADLIDPNADFQKRWLSYTKEFGEASDIVVVVEAKSPDQITAALDDLAERLKDEPNLFQSILYKIEHDHLRRKGLQYLTPAQLEICLAQLRELRPAIQGDWERISLERVIAQILQRMNLLQLAMTATGGDLSPLPGPTPKQMMRLIGQHVTALASSLSQSLANPADASNPWPQFVSVDGDLAESATRPTYFLNDRGTQGFLQVKPVVDKQALNGADATIHRLRDIVADLKPDHPGVRIGLTGIPVLEHDEMTRSQTDMTLATIVSGVGVLGMLLLGFHGVRHSLLAMAVLGVGLLWAFTYATATVGHLTILSSAFASILMGLGIDYSIVYLSRYLELRHRGEDLQQALGNAASSIGASIVTVALTTGIAFFCATFTNFLGVAELGMISAGGVIVSAVATFLLLPALVAVLDRNKIPAQLPSPIQGQSLRWMTSRHPWIMAGGGLITMSVFAAQAFHWDGGWPKFAIGYDYNLLNLQARGVESVEVQHRMFDESNSSLLFAVSLADSADEARALKAEFEKLPTVRKVEELASHLPATPANQTKLLIQAAHAEVAKLQPVSYTPRMMNPEAIGKLVERLYQVLMKNDEAWAQQAAKSLDDFLERFSVMELDQQVRFLNEFQARMNFALHRQLEALAAASDPEPITLQDFPSALVSRFVSSEQKWLLQVFPKEQIWDIGPLRQFVEDVRSVDPEVTGTPLQNFEASQQIRQSYQDSAGYAFMAVVLTLLFDLLGYRQAVRVLSLPALFLAAVWGLCRWGNLDVSRELLGGLYLLMVIMIAWMVNSEAVCDAGLALLPPTGGAAIMFGIMRLMHVDLNPANLIVLPLLLGIGVDGGVHVIHDFRLQANRRYRISPSIVNSLILTSTTTTVGFGALLLAAHRGLFTFGLVLTIGVNACLFLSLLTLPALLTLIDRFRHRTGSRRFNSHPASTSSIFVTNSPVTTA